MPEGELCAVCLDRATGYHYGKILFLYAIELDLFKEWQVAMVAKLFSAEQLFLTIILCANIMAIAT